MTLYFSILINETLIVFIHQCQSELWFLSILIISHLQSWLRSLFTLIIIDRYNHELDHHEYLLYLLTYVIIVNHFKIIRTILLIILNHLIVIIDHCITLLYPKSLLVGLSTLIISFLSSGFPVVLKYSFAEWSAHR